MRGRRALFGSALAALMLAGSLSMATPASAAGKPNPGSCASHFTASSTAPALPGYTYPGTDDPSVSDKNGDQVVCWAPLPQAAYQVVDNNVGGKPSV